MRQRLGAIRRHRHLATQLLQLIAHRHLVDRVVLGHQDTQVQWRVVRRRRVLGGIGIAARPSLEREADAGQVVAVGAVQRGAAHVAAAGRDHRPPPFGRRRRIADDVHVNQHAVAVLVARDDRRRDAGLRAPIGQPLADVLAQLLARAAHVDAQSVQPRRRPGRRLGRIQVDGDRKTAAQSQFTGHLDRTPHQFGQARADRQTDARASHQVRSAIDLVERLEQADLVFGADADATVDHLEMQAGAAVRQDLGAQPRHHMAGIGELDGVVDQVVENLPDTAAVAHHPRRRRGIDTAVDDQPLLFGHAGIGGDAMLHQLARIEAVHLEPQLAGLDLGDVEDVADQLLQDHRRVLDAVDMPALLVVQVGQRQHFERAEHAIQERADLVAHGGQEGRFGLVGAVGLLLGLRQRVFHFGARADVGESTQHHVLLLVARGRKGHEQRPPLVGAEGLDGARPGGAQDLAQQLVGFRRIPRLLAHGDAQPLDGQRVAEHHAAVEARQHAQRHRRGIEHGAVELLALDHVEVGDFSRLDDAPVVPEQVDRARRQAQPEHQQDRDRQPHVGAEEAAVVQLVIAGPAARPIGDAQHQPVAAEMEAGLPDRGRRALADEYAGALVLQPKLVVQRLAQDLL
ncbi:Uncharacterised protein [Achromobacter xylosoxidans]|nr:Uncharacterised protein [Achromobacter xylosoxidans]